MRIAGGATKFAAFGPVVEDVYPQRGPLGGIHAALRHSISELNLMLAVDLPFVEPGFLHYLISQARESRATITVPQAAGRWQPPQSIAANLANVGMVCMEAERKDSQLIDALQSSASLPWA